TGISVGGLVASRLFRRTRWPAVAASLVLVGYVGFQYLQKQKALAFGEQYARAQGLEDAVVSAQPRPVSAFNWTVFVSDEREHRFAHVDVARREPRRLGPDAGFLARLDEPYLPPEKAVWETRSRFGDPSVAALVREAWNSPPLGFFRWFAALPAFDGMSGGSTCVWFSDLRF